MNTLLQDLRYALRTLRKTPGFAAVAILMLALAIGANTAIFTAVDGVLLRPLPTPELDRVAALRQDMPAYDLRDAPISPLDVEELTAETEIFQSLAGLREMNWNLTGSGEPVRLAGMQTLGDFFSLFAVRPHLGQLYRAENSTNGEDAVAVLTYSLWQQLFGGDPGALGQMVRLDGRSYEVIGVLPPEFRYPRSAQIFTPFPMTDEWRQPQRRGTLIMSVVARLHPGITPEQLDGWLQSEAQNWGGERNFTATPFLEILAGPLRAILLVLLGAVGFVLLIACANVASLQLVRATARARELAVRTALGAGRGRIIRQLLVESVLLALAGALLGLWIGGTALDLLARWAGHTQPALVGLRLDATALAFTALVTLLATALFGLAPALRTARVQPQSVLREAEKGSTGGLGRQRFLQGAVVVQMALTLVLLLGSGLMLRTLSRILAIDPGFRAEQVMSFQLALPAYRYGTGQQRLAFYENLLERLGTLPGVQLAGLGDVPLTGLTDSSPFAIPDRPEEPGGPKRHANIGFGSTDYFRALGIPLLRGRGFGPSDRPDAPIATLIDEQFANQFFPGEDPVGRRIVHGMGEATIVGVVGSIDSRSLGEPPKATAYYSMHQFGTRSTAVVVRSALEPTALAGMLRGAVRDLDPELPIYDLQTMEERVSNSLSTHHLATAAIGGFAALSLILSVLGIYGVMRYSTNQRTREIGIRVALGAEPRDVMGMVVRQGMTLAALGLVGGLLTALALTRLLAGLLYGISAYDPLTYAVVTTLLAALAGVTCWLPARRATQVDPMVALRAE
jgi:predicted permease